MLLKIICRKKIKLYVCRVINGMMFVVKGTDIIHKETLICQVDPLTCLAFYILNGKYNHQMQQMRFF